MIKKVDRAGMIDCTQVGIGRHYNEIRTASMMFIERSRSWITSDKITEFLKAGGKAVSQTMMGLDESHMSRVVYKDSYAVYNLFQLLLQRHQRLLW